MTTGRLEAFSDAVIAILMTIMVLELRPPDDTDLHALHDLGPVFFSYVLSFVYLGIYWNNHHHMLQAVDKVSGGVLWANLHLLFWLSLFPFATAWMGEHDFAKTPTALYGVLSLAAAIAYYVLQQVMVKAQGPGSALEAAIGSDIKGKMSPVLYASAVPLAFVSPWIALSLYAVVAAVWLVPDRRVEQQLT
jgi:uncharacterized membrane protein